MFSNGRLQFDGESKDVDNFIKLFIYESLMFNWDRAVLKEKHSFFHMKMEE